MSDNAEVVAAIHDLTRVVIALSGQVASKADAVRRLKELGIPPVRIAAILAMEGKQVHSALTKAKQREV